MFLICFNMYTLLLLLVLLLLLLEHVILQPTQQHLTRNQPEGRFLAATSSCK
jgi:hypothetical protein